MSVQFVSDQEVRRSDEVRISRHLWTGFAGNGIRRSELKVSNVNSTFKHRSEIGFMIEFSECYSGRQCVLIAEGARVDLICLKIIPHPCSFSEPTEKYIGALISPVRCSLWTEARYTVIHILEMYVRNNTALSIVYEKFRKIPS